ncbi:shikimate dehydrogenase [Methanoculleus sp. FWC-SCC1]|uniref:Shikimate dehydrogenase (NADP(+)) n=1 Tax=Methanoculleus frigidifontis TaxID=2584085 RepID=A0ABT8M674_9EURY|nr:shikimate dehydrogenase [Methanoculleus sp. FWC-SCC1]MDN7023437.1 shikimate dehydrogenase [Methanoculleus sp. FWC-SCC1]
MKVVLTGFRGTGKTTVGRRLAEHLHLPLIDTDACIEEQAGMPIPEIFRSRGEAGFRLLEREVIASLRNEDCVIATGGGAVCDPANVEDLRYNATIVLLTADPGVIEERIRGSDRPALTDLPAAGEIRHLLQVRRQAYRSSADVCIETGNAASPEIAAWIARTLAEGTVSAGNRREAALLAREMGIGDAVAGDPATRLCGIAGNPCAHSKSPGLYKRLFERFGMNYRYTRFEWHDIGTIVRLARLLDVRGMSVTIPFKVDIVPYLDEVSEDAAAIGAVNTVVQCGGVMQGFNTDWLGIRIPLRHRAGGRAVVLGAGGAAAAAVYALQSLDMEVTVLNRTPEKARTLASRYGCAAGGLDAFEGRDVDVVVNTTPVGMEGDARSLLTVEQLEMGMTVYDCVYTPPETPLLREAVRAGCETIAGTEMFVHQAVEQFRLITGIAVEPALVREMME